jgi:uncharacterized protein
MAVHHALLLFAAAVLAGAVNAVAGGGTMLTFPALIVAGQVERLANATSTVALWPGALSSFWAYRAELPGGMRTIVALSVPSFVGGVLGAVLLLHTNNATFAAIVPALVFSATLLFIVQEPLAKFLKRRGGDVLDVADNSATKPGVLRWAAVLAFQFLVGVYGGYFGAGIGILMLAAFGLLGFTNIHHINALKNLNAMAINGIAAVIFIAQGLVDWRLALWMAIGSVVGGYAGAGTARRVGQRTVRRTIVIIGLTLSAWLLWQHLGAYFG